MLRRKLVIGLTVLAAAAFAGGAYAATQTSSPRQTFLNDVAKRLHVTPAQLQSALAGAFQDQLNAAVKAGRLTQAQANAIEQRMKQRGGAPFPFAPWRHGFARPPLAPQGLLGAAAGYLGLTRDQLLDQLTAGRSLAQIAKSKGKSTSGLEQAITAAVKARLDQAVARGLITSAREQHMLSRLKDRLNSVVNRSLHIRHLPPFGPGAAPGQGPGPGPGWGGPWPRPGSFSPPPGPGQPA
jgi:hypothetical protein